MRIVFTWLNYLKSHVSLGLHKRMFYFFVVFIWVAVPGYAQQEDSCTYFIEGKVFEAETRLPLPFASIRIVGTEFGATTDDNGYFRIDNLCEIEFDVEITFIGYQSVLHHHDLYHKYPTIYLAADDFLLESVVIEGEFHGTHVISAAASILEGRKLKEKNASNFGELAAHVSGVNTISTGSNIVKPVLHGLHSNRILIINNGVRHQFQNWGTEHAPEIDPSMIDRLEVVKGAATVAFGPEALGGVILLDQEKPELHRPLGGDFTVSGYTNGKGLKGNLNVAKGYDKFSWRAGFSGDFHGDLHAPTYNLTNTGKREWGGNLSVLYHEDNWEIEAFVSHFDQTLGILRGSITGNLADLTQAMSATKPLYTQPFSYDLNTPRQEVTHDLVRLAGSLTLGEHMLKAKYSFQSNHRQEYDVRRGTNNEIPSIDLILQGQTFDIEWMTPEIKHWNHVGGIQWEYQDNNNIFGTNTIPFIPNFNTYRVGLYSIHTWEQNNNTWEAGVRYDYFFSDVRGRATDNSLFFDELRYDNLTATVGYVHAFNSEVTIRSNVGSSWRPPNVSELYIFGKHQSSIEYGLKRYQVEEDGSISGDGRLQNTGKKIEAERGVKWISTLEVNRQRYQWGVSAYINGINDFIYARPAGITNTVRGAFPYFIYQQANAFFWGADLDMNYQFTEGVEISWSANVVFAKNTLLDTRFTEIPPLSTQLGMTKSYMLSEKSNIAIGVEGKYVFNQFLEPRVISPEDIFIAKQNNVDLFAQDPGIFDFLEAPPAYFLLNSFVQWEKPQFSLRFQGNNLLNTSFRVYTDRLRYFADQQGANFVFTLRVTL